MTVPVVAQLSSTDLNKASGRVLDRAAEGPVRILRRNQRFVLLREEALDEMLEVARDDRPQSLEDMLDGYDPDKIRRLAGGFLSDPPTGKEML